MSEQTDADFLRELAHYTSTLSPENEARVRLIADFLDRCDLQQLRFALSDAQQAMSAALGWLDSDVDTERAIEILRAALKRYEVTVNG